MLWSKYQRDTLEKLPFQSFLHSSIQSSRFKGMETFHVTSPHSSAACVWHRLHYPLQYSRCSMIWILGAVDVTEEFNVEVGLHQGSTLSPFLLLWWWTDWQMRIDRNFHGWWFLDMTLWSVVKAGGGKSREVEWYCYIVFEENSNQRLLKHHKGLFWFKSSTFI